MTEDYDPEKERLFQIQRDIQSRIDNTPHIKNYRYIAGADLTERDGLFVGCFVVVDCQDNLKVRHLRQAKIRPKKLIFGVFFVQISMKCYIKNSCSTKESQNFYLA